MRQTLQKHLDIQPTLEAALEFSRRGNFERWLDAFLRGQGNNVPLADGLKLQQRWWIGPEERNLIELGKKCGPGLEFNESESAWKQRITELSVKIKGGLLVPPLLAEFKDGRLHLADGNHRCGALELAHITKYWTAIWFNSQDERQAFFENGQ